MSEPAANRIPRPIRALPTREYVSGAVDYALLGLRQAVRALPHYVDSLEAELGDDSYQHMQTDPQVSSSLDLLKAAILEDVIALTLAPTPEGDAAAAQQAADLLAFCERSLDALTTPLADVLWDLLDALAFGNRVAEIIYTQPTEGDDRGRYVLSAIKPKPRPSVLFVIDRYLNIVGLLGAQPGQSRVMVAGALNAAQRANLLPREKFAILTWRPRNGDPRGSTVLRAAYNPWWIKTQAWPEFIKLLMQFATPSVYGITPENAPGDPTTGKSAEELLLDALVLLQNGSAVALRYGSTLDTIEAGEGGAQAFDAITELLNREITKAILGSTRATMEAQHGSRADSDTSKSLFDTLVRMGRRTVATMLQRDVIGRLIELNFGKAALPFAPHVVVGGVEEEDKTPSWNAAAALERAGYLDASQYQELDAAIGLPPRTPEEAKARGERRAMAPIPPAPETQAPDDDDEDGGVPAQEQEEEEGETNAPA